MVISIDGEYDVSLYDDGTTNTVVDVSHERWEKPHSFIYGQKTAAPYRDNEGCLDLQAFADDVVIPDAEMEE